MSKLLINESPLQVLPTLAITIGLNEAIILQQIHYWLNPDHNKNYKDGRHWVYNSLEAWHQQFPFWSVDTLKRTFNSLLQQKLIVRENLNDNKFTRIPWYSINYHTLETLEEQSESEAKNLANPRSCRKVQNALIEEGKMHSSRNAICPNRTGQNDLIEQCKLPLSYIDAETTTEINQESSVFENDTHTDKNSKLDEAQTQKVSPHETAQKMLTLFSHYVEGGKELKLYPEREHKLVSVLESQCCNDLNLWERVCKNIASSSLLMGEKKGPGYKTNLNWVLQDFNATIILEGSYGVGDRKIEKSDPKETETDILSKIENLNEPPVMKELREWMVSRYGTATYKSWFEALSLIESDDTKLLLRVPSKFIQEYVSVNFMYEVQEHLKDRFNKEIRVVLEAAPQNKPKAEEEGHT